MTSADRLKHFKGEAWGTTGLCASADRAPRRSRSLETARREASRLVERVEGTRPISSDYKQQFSERYQQFMQSGPGWCRLVWEEEHYFLHRMFDVVRTMAATR